MQAVVLAAGEGTAALTAQRKETERDDCGCWLSKRSDYQLLRQCLRGDSDHISMHTNENSMDWLMHYGPLKTTLMTILFHC